MRIIKLIPFALALLLFSTTNAQKIKVKTGELKTLKGQTEINVVYDYSAMKVGKMEESAYLEKRTAKLNKKKEGRGDEWQTKWKEDREKKFEPAFEKLCNKMLKKRDVKISKNEKAKYTMKIHTTKTDPGYEVFAKSKPAYISGDVYFYETNSPDKIIIHMTFKKSPGNAVFSSWDTGARIKESYAKLGKSIGKYLSRKAFR